MREKVAGYGRVSTIHQVEDGTSSEEQEQIVTEECKKKGWELVHFYSDEGYSGKNNKRPGFFELLNDAKKGTFQTVMFTKLDRFGRSLRDILNSWNELTDLNIKIYCIKQPELNSEGVYGKLLIHLLGAFAEFEHSMIAERTSSGRLIKWKANKALIGTVPYGYTFNKETKKIEVNPEQRAVYEKIVSLYLEQRLSTTNIALQLNRELIPPPYNKGKQRWYYAGILRILKNPAYTGEVTYNRFERVLKTDMNGKQYHVVTKKQKSEDKLVKVQFEPLITHEKWGEIQNLIKNNTMRVQRKYKEYEDHFILEKGLIKCGECGAKMQKVLVRPGKTAPAHFFYACYWKGQTKKRELYNHKECSLQVDAEMVDNYVFNQVVDFLSNPSAFAKAFYKDEDVDNLKQRIQHLENNKITQKKKLEAMYAKYFILDEPNKEILQPLIKNEEKKMVDIEEELKRLATSYEFTKHKVDRLSQFEQVLKDGTLSEKIRTSYKTKAQFIKYLNGLSFEQKQKVIEGVISPETGGTVTIYHHRPDLEIDEYSDEKMRKHYKPDLKAEPIIDIDFSADLQRIENIIVNLSDRRKICYDISLGKEVDYIMRSNILELPKVLGNGIFNPVRIGVITSHVDHYRPLCPWLRGYGRTKGLKYRF